MADTDGQASYACDRCRSRKISCSRTRSGCQRCKDENAVCAYSRSGIIRRNRKRKHDGPELRARGSPSARSGDLHDGPQSQENSTCQRLKLLAGKELSAHPSFKVLASLFDAYGAIWQDQSAFDDLAKNADSKYFPFADRAAAWTDEFVSFIETKRPLMIPVPPEVREQLATGRPHQVRDRAWLVMFYSIVSWTIPSSDPSSESTKSKLKSNIWLAFNDVKLLLEPSDIALQAILILSRFAEDIMTPSLCWMLVTHACSMLQTLGISHWHLDLMTSERRAMLFWQLNVWDKSLALLSRRPPTLHRTLADDVAMPTLDQLLSCQPKSTAAGMPTMFGAHCTHQMHLLSRLMADIWPLVYGRPGQNRNLPAILTTKDNLESWYRQAMEVLEAAAVTEKPFLDTKRAASIDCGLKYVRFQFDFLSVLLTLPCKELRDHSTRVARQMLASLDDTTWEAVEGEQPYPGFMWQLLFGSLNPFLALFGGILSKGEADLEQNREALEAMEHLPPFLRKMSPRYPFAAKLESIAVRFVEHTRAMLGHQEDKANDEAPNPTDSVQPTPGLLHTGGHDLIPESDSLSTTFAMDHFGNDNIDWMFWDQIMQDSDSRLTRNPESVTGAGKLWYEQ